MFLCILMFLCIAAKGNKIEERYKLILRYIIVIVLDTNNALRYYL